MAKKKKFMNMERLEILFMSFTSFKEDDIFSAYDSDFPFQIMEVFLPIYRSYVLG